MHRTLPLLALLALACTGDKTDSAADTAAAGGTDGTEPPAVTVTLSPQQPSTLDDLVAAVDPLLPEGATIEWYADSGAVGGFSYSLLASETTKGETWTAAVVLDGALLGDDAVTIGNAPPACVAATIGPLGATPDEVLTCGCTAYTDPDDDPAADGRCVFVDADTDAVLQEDGACALPGGTVEADTAVRCTYTPFDGADYGESATSNPLLVEAEEEP